VESIVKTRHLTITGRATALMTVSVLLLTGCSGDKRDAAEPSTISPSSGGVPSSEPSSLAEYDGPIAAGSYRVPLISWHQTYPVDALVEVPDGFITPGGWVVENGLDGTKYGDLMFWGDVGRVDAKPCEAGQLVKPGPTVRDLAEVLTDQVPRWSTTPKPVSIGGYPGLYVKITPPRDLSRCNAGEFTVWAVNDGDCCGYSADQPGTVVHLWILDIDGQRVVIAVKVVPGHTAHATELVHMAETAAFVEHVDG
jgi:hypothetical protein